MASGHLLVVDDEPAILGTLKKALTLEGYRVDVAGGAKLADTRVQAGAYDLVLLDVALPDGDGVELLGRWRSAGITTPVVMMSGHATIDLAVKALQLGATDFLEKPLSTDRLLVVIDNTLRLTHALAEQQTLRKEAGYFDELIGTSGPMRELTQRISRVAPTRAAVLITGERGTGKELVAKAIHRLSPRRSRNSTVQRFRKICSKVSCLVTNRGRLPERPNCDVASSSVPMVERCFWTKSVTCRCRSRPSCCVCCRSRRSSASAVAI